MGSCSYFTMIEWTGKIREPDGFEIECKWNASHGNEMQRKCTRRTPSPTHSISSTNITPRRGLLTWREKVFYPSSFVLTTIEVLPSKRIYNLIWNNNEEKSPGAISTQFFSYSFCPAPPSQSYFFQVGESNRWKVNLNKFVEYEAFKFDIPSPLFILDWEKSGRMIGPSVLVWMKSEFANNQRTCLSPTFSYSRCWISIADHGGSFGKRRKREIYSLAKEGLSFSF